MVAFEWRNAIDGHVSDFKNQRVASCFEGMKERGIESMKQTSIMAFLIEVFESVHRIRENGIETGRRPRLRVFEVRERRNNASRRERGYRGRGVRKVIDLDVTLRRRKKHSLIYFVDETIAESVG